MPFSPTDGEFVQGKETNCESEYEQYSHSMSILRVFRNVTELQNEHCYTVKTLIT